MRCSTVTTIVLLIVLVAGWNAPARADDVMPPAWRGQPGSTMQHWMFTAGLFPPWSPDVVTNPYGQPSADLGPGTMVWYDEYEGRNGVVHTYNNAFIFDIPNNPELGIEKRIWIQVTYRPVMPTYWEVIWPLGGYWGAAAPDESWFIDHGDGWTTEVASITIPTNPPQETIYIWWQDCSTWVDQVVIDTLCVPFPPCDEDVNGDDVVNVLDLLLVIANWGPCPEPCPPYCPCDINEDCVVNVLDLLAVIAAWGPCP